MLHIIRDNVQSFGVKLIVAVIAVVMLTFGLSTYRNQGINTIAKVDGYEIKIEDYQRAYDQAELQYQEQYQKDAELFMEIFQIKTQVLEQLINNAILRKNARANGFEVSDLELANTIFETPAFRTDDRFDKKKYDDMLKNLRTNKIAYEKDQRELILMQKYIRFLNAGISFNRTYMESEYRRLHTEMDVKVVELTPSLFADQVTVAEEKIRAYYDSHKSEFEQKKQIVIDYILLSVEDVKDGVIVREKEIERYYHKHKDSDFTVKESYNSRQILITTGGKKEPKDDKKAKELADRLYSELRKNRKKFAKLAMTYSEDPGSREKGGNLGWVDKGTFMQQYEEAIDSLEVGDISKPIRSQFGYHIVELIDRKEAGKKSLEEVKEEISELVKIGKAKRRLANKAAKLLQVEENENKPTMQELATSLQKTLKQTVPFDDKQNLEELEYSYRLYTDLNAKNLGERGTFEMSSDKGILVYEVSKVVDPFIKPFEIVKNQIRIFAQQEAEREFAKQKGREFEKDIRTKEQFDKLIESLKTEAANLKFKLADNDSGAGNMEFKTEVFKMAAGEVKLITRGQAEVLVFMNAKSDSKEAIDENEIKELEIQLQKQKARILLNGIIANTKKETDINYNKAMLAKLQIAPVS